MRSNPSYHPLEVKKYRSLLVKQGLSLPSADVHSPNCYCRVASIGGRSQLLANVGPKLLYRAIHM